MKCRVVVPVSGAKKKKKEIKKGGKIERKVGSEVFSSAFHTELTASGCFNREAERPRALSKARGQETPVNLFRTPPRRSLLLFPVSSRLVSFVVALAT